MVILCWNKNANVSQHVIARIWLKRNYISESYWRRWEKWKKVKNERKRKEGRGRKTKSCGNLWRCVKSSQTKLQAKRCVNAPQAAITFAKRRFAAVWANISRALSSRSGLRVHFTFLPWQKHFTFRQKERRRKRYPFICRKISRPARRGTLSLIDIVVPLGTLSAPRRAPRDLFDCFFRVW